MSITKLDGFSLVSASEVKTGDGIYQHATIEPFEDDDDPYYGHVISVKQEDHTYIIETDRFIIPLEGHVGVIIKSQN